MFPYSDVVGFLKDKHKLTKKEAQVLAEIIISGPNKETIALKLEIAPSTAYLHFKRLYEKLQVEGMAQLYHLVLQTHQKLATEGATSVQLKSAAK